METIHTKKEMNLKSMFGKKKMTPMPKKMVYNLQNMPLMETKGFPDMRPKKKPQLSQRDKYAKAMYGASRRGGSNGIGVGY
jgi:hypothetical protein